jgi:hypothetical protein
MKMHPFFILKKNRRTGRPVIFLLEVPFSKLRINFKSQNAKGQDKLFFLFL